MFIDQWVEQLKIYRIVYLCCSNKDDIVQNVLGKNIKNDVHVYRDHIIKVSICDTSAHDVQAFNLRLCSTNSNLSYNVPT